MKLDINSITKRIFAQQFSKLDNVVWSITDGNLAVVGQDENLTSLVTNSDGTLGISQSSFNMFGIPIPAFATRATLAQLSQSDLLVVGPSKELFWVVEKAQNHVKVMSTSGIVTSLVPTNVTSFGGSGDGGTYMRVQNLTSALGGGSEALGGLQGMLLPLLMSGGDLGDSLEKLMPMMLLTGGGGLGNNNSIMQMMVYQSLLGGKGLNLPF